ncbi:MAG: mycothiol maleylpyruvate isomerase, partial [Candidatus Lutibacillus vidarii]
ARADLDAVPAGADPLVRTALGGMRVSAYLSTRTIELVVHGGDLARAVGVPFEAPEEALTEVVAILGAVAVRRRLAQPLLAAMTGRERLPEGFTVL